MNKFSEDKKRLEKFVDDTIDRNRSKIYRALRDKKGGPVKLKTRTILIGDTRYYATVTIWDSKEEKLLRWNEVFYSISRNRSGKKIIIQYNLNDSEEGVIDKKSASQLKRNIFDKSCIMIYENHLLNRYRERYLGLGPGEISFEDLAERFMSGRENEASIVKFSKELTIKGGNDKGGNEYLEIEARRSDGIYFGIADSMGKFRYITYITPEMATREGQDFIRDEVVKDLEETYEVMRSLNLIA